MFEQLFKRPYYIKRHTQAPFLEERIKYLQSLQERGRVDQTIRDTAQYLLRIIEFLNLESKQTASLEEIDQAADRWARYQSKHPQKRRQFSPSAKDHFTWHAIHWLQINNRLTALPEESTPLITKIFERGAALKRHANSPLLKERLLYLQYWKVNGAGENELRGFDHYLLRIMEYLDFYALRAVTENEIQVAAERWAKAQKVNRKNTLYSKSAKEKFIRDATRWLEMLGCLKKALKEAIPFESYLTQFLEFMRNEQSLSESTIKSRFFVLKDFLIHIDKKEKDFRKITALLIDEIIIKKHQVDNYSRRSVQSYVSIIRSFLRYAETKEWCNKNLADCIKAPRVYRYESLPYSPSWDDVKKILATSKTDFPTDIRDHAILMLLAIYGLRCSEVTHLSLEDIDWKNEQLYLKRSKSAKPQIFPLVHSVGEAIVNYLKNVRPCCALREIFVCRRAPYRPLKSSTIFAIVNRRLKPLNLRIKHHGPHALRHACATHLINEGLSLKEISDHLGHQGLDTTRIYAKVDLVNLRKVTEGMNLGDLL
ncbi:TPA: tyrosine-type recombinase/integrase [Legionella pneumophila]|nr:tyrosine-type recombinase/integrase [Legionella pneumophila]